MQNISFSEFFKHKLHNSHFFVHLNGLHRRRRL